MRSHALSLTLFLALVAILLSGRIATPAFAQVDAGALRGTVTDPAGP